MANVLLKVISYANYDKYIVSKHDILDEFFTKNKGKYVKINNLYNSLHYFATEYEDFQFLPKRLTDYNGYELFDKIIPCYRLRYESGKIYFQKYFLIIYTSHTHNKDSVCKRIKILQSSFKEIAILENYESLDNSNIEYSIIRKYLNKAIVDEIDSRLKLFLENNPLVQWKYLKI